MQYDLFLTTENQSQNLNIMICGEYHGIYLQWEGSQIDAEGHKTGEELYVAISFQY